VLDWGRERTETGPKSARISEDAVIWERSVKSGHFPWDDGYDPEGATVQPLLG